MIRSYNISASSSTRYPKRRLARLTISVRLGVELITRRANAQMPGHLTSATSTCLLDLSGTILQGYLFFAIAFHSCIRALVVFTKGLQEIDWFAGMRSTRFLWKRIA